MTNPTPPTRHRPRPTEPGEAEASFDHVAAETVDRLHAAADHLAVLADRADTRVEAYRLGHLATLAWLAGQRGEQLLAALEADRRVTGEHGARHNATRGPSHEIGDPTSRPAPTDPASLSDVVEPLAQAHQRLGALLDVLRPFPSLQFVNDLGAFCQEVTVHVQRG